MSGTPMFDKDSVGVAKGRPGGYAAVFPVGTDISVLADPSKTLKELIGQYHGASLGYISEDGVTFTTDTDSEGHNDWGGSEVARDLTSYADSAQMTFIQSSVAVLKTIYGDDNVTESGPTVTVRHNRNFTDPHVYVFDSVISSTKVLRNVIPIGQAFKRDDVSYNSSDLLGYTPTITCVPYNDDGDTHTTAIYDTVKAARAAQVAVQHDEGAAEEEPKAVTA